MDGEPRSAPIVVIGCGNLNRSDDGVGVVCARRLAAELAGDIERGEVAVFDAGTGGFDVMYRMRGARTLIVIDACRSGSEPGAVFEVPGDRLEVAVDPGVNLHAFRWDHALWVGRKLLGDAFPDDVAVWLVEAETVELGLELSAAVGAATDHVVDRIRRRVRPTIEANHGNLYFDREVVDRFLAGVEAIAVLTTDTDALRIVPIKGAGGLLLKQRNKRGDRVVQAIEVLRRVEVEQATMALEWDSERGDLLATPIVPIAPDSSKTVK